MIFIYSNQLIRPLTVAEMNSLIITTDQDTYARFRVGMLERGIRLIGRGIWFTSTEHTGEDIARTLKADEVLAGL